ncbi:MAG: class II glutamine amidotransferase [Myxococcota bacterium]
MCRIFGFRSAVPSRAHRSLVAAENALATQSIRHPHGWGIGYVKGDDAYVVKSARSAHDCPRFKSACERLTSHTFVVHVRKATVGCIDSLNAHPFRFGRWLFAHNGTIFGFEDRAAHLRDRIDPDLRSHVMGDTDSEHLFFVLLTALRRAGIDRATHDPKDAPVVGQVVRDVLYELDAEARVQQLDRPILNVLLTDGRTFVAHRAGMPMFLSTQKRHCPDADTCPAANKVCLLARRPVDQSVNHLIVASEPIGAENLWEEVPDGTTVVCDERFALTMQGAPRGWVAPVLPEHARSDGLFRAATSAK